MINLKKYDPIVWFKEGKWKIGYVIEGDFQGKTIVKIGDNKYETHTNTLKKFMLERGGQFINIHPLDWKEIVNKDIANKKITVDFSISDILKCSYPEACNCTTNIQKKDCKNSYREAYASLSDLVDEKVYY